MEVMIMGTTKATTIAATTATLPRDPRTRTNHLSDRYTYPITDSHRYLVSLLIASFDVYVLWCMHHRVLHHSRFTAQSLFHSSPTGITKHRIADHDEKYLVTMEFMPNHTRKLLLADLLLMFTFGNHGNDSRSLVFHMEMVPASPFVPTSDVHEMIDAETLPHMDSIGVYVIELCQREHNSNRDGNALSTAFFLPGSHLSFRVQQIFLV